MGRVFASDPVRLGFNSRSCHIKDSNPALLNTQYYKVRIKGSGAIQGKEYHPLHLGVVAIEKGAIVSSSTTVPTFTYLYIYICKYV